jgi:hypothetical protein
MPNYKTIYTYIYVCVCVCTYIYIYYGVLASPPLTANKSRSNAQNEILEGKLSDADTLSTCLFYTELMCVVC